MAKAPLLLGASRLVSSRQLTRRHHLRASLATCTLIDSLGCRALLIDGSSLDTAGRRCVQVLNFKYSPATYVPATLQRRLRAAAQPKTLCNLLDVHGTGDRPVAHTRSPAHGKYSPALPWPTYATATSLSRMALDATELDHVCQKVAPLVPGRSLQLLSHSHDLSPAITGPALMSSHQGTNFSRV